MVSLIEDDHLNACELQIGFEKELHESSGSGDDDIWILWESLKLSLEGVSSQNEAVTQIDFMQEHFEHMGNLICEITSGDQDEGTSSHDLRVRLQFVDEG